VADAGVPHGVPEYPGAVRQPATAGSPLTPLLRVTGFSHGHDADAKRRILACFDQHLRPPEQ